MKKSQALEHNGSKIIEMNNLKDVASDCESGQVWWALYTRHQHEKTVAQNLTNKGFDVFLPLYESTRRWRDRTKNLWLPLFPCYVFLRGGLNRRSMVVTTPGVHMVLYNGERVAVIPDAEMDAIRLVVSGPAPVEPHPYLRCGERVRVTRGSLTGVEGVLLRKKSLYRLVLSVEMLAQSVSVEINALDVEPLNESRQLTAPVSRSAGHGNVAQPSL